MAAAARGRAALPVQRMLEILRKDPGLVLEIKQAVIDAAADEGRIVNASELTDAALFSMVETDPAIAALASEHISSRGYFSQKQISQTPQETETARSYGMSNRTGSAVERDTPTLAAMPEIGSGDVSHAIAQVAEQSATSATGAIGVSGESAPAIKGNPKAEQALAVGKDSGPKAQPENGTRTEKPVFTSRPHPYANVPALADLYSQVVNGMPVLERFGANIFRNGTGNADDLPMDLPVGPDYVVGPGDGLKIELWGGIAERLQRVVDREGRIGLPEVGTVQVAGRNLADVQALVQAALRSQFRDVQAEISLSRLRTVRVYVVGDVERPGAYDISALSTPLNALYAAGGPTLQGSMRTLRHYRGERLVQEVDVYELILNGVRSGLQRLEPGDTVLVPPVGGEVTIEGMVHRPAVYELHGEKTLAEVLKLAGGVLPSGTMRRIDLERLDAHEKRTMVSFELPETNDSKAIANAVEGFTIQPDDRIHISPIVPYSYRTVYLDGHVFKPGKQPWREGMQLKDLLRSYSDLLPEPYRQHAEIVRLSPPDYRPQVIGFNLADALGGETGKMPLQAFDTVRVFGRYDFEDPPEITISGEVRDPGSHRTNGQTRLRDAIYLAGGLTPDALLDDVQIFRQVAGSKVQVLSASLGKALAGDEVENILLIPRDQVIVHRNIAKMDPAVVYIRGQVAVPGRYPLGDGMTASDLVRVAGGLRRGAYTETADLARFTAQTGKDAVRNETHQISIGRALSGDAEADLTLRDGDVLSIRQISGWDDIGASVTINGEVAHAGTYGIAPGERLSSVLKRAGGFYRSAYPAAAILKRVQVKELAEKSKAALVQRLEAAVAEPPQFSPGTNVDEQVALTRAMQQQHRQLIANLKNQEPDGRLVIRLSADLKKWENTPDDIELRDGDTLIIPKKPTFVLVAGQVYNPAALNFVPGKSAGWYLRKAGGPTELANKKGIFIVRADGSVAGGRSGWWDGGVLGVSLQPGDTVVVPERIMGGGSVWRTLLSSAQMMSALAISAKLVSGL